MFDPLTIALVLSLLANVILLMLVVGFRRLVNYLLYTHKKEIESNVDRFSRENARLTGEIERLKLALQNEERVRKALSSGYQQVSLRQQETIKRQSLLLRTIQQILFRNLAGIQANEPQDPELAAQMEQAHRLLESVFGEESP
jgi:hypothetical protein